MRLSIDSSLVRYLLGNAYFINGSAYAGKSTMVRMLAEKHNGILCGENYHSEMEAAFSPEHQPNLCYFDTMSGWEEFLSRSPEAYAAWIEGVNREAAEAEILLLVQKCAQGKPVFVDTNIPVEILREIAPWEHVAIMLAPPEVSAGRFFEREDAEKQFLYQELLKMKEPEKAMGNFRACLERLNSQENYDAFMNSGFFVVTRDENRSPGETMAMLEKHFGL